MEQRKTSRLPMQRRAWIECGEAAPLACQLHDVSDEGAQIGDLDPGAVPDEFSLRFTKTGSVRRQCRVVWRAAERIGVRFLNGSSRERLGLTRSGRTARA